MKSTLLIAAMCLAEVLSMAGFATYPALLPTFIDVWQLSNTEAGWISSVFYLGYMLSVPVLVSMTDHVDPKPLYLGSMALFGAATLAFPFFAVGLWSAMGLRFLAGIGLAGTYMPGLKALSDLIGGSAQSRAVAFYTSSFGIGASGSFLLAGAVAERLGWRGAFTVSAAGPAMALLIAQVVLPRRAPPARNRRKAIVRDFVRVLRNRTAMGYVLCYAAHNYELFGFRSWVVAFLTFSQARQSGPAAFWPPTVLAALFNLIGLPASVTGNELATRYGRRRVLAAIMLGSALLAGVLGFTAESYFPWVAALCLVYGFTVTGDSSAITAGAVAAAEPELRGTTMAVHSTIGFMGSFVGPVVFGAVLDAGGGGTSATSWGLAFATMGLGVALGPLALGLMAALERRKGDSRGLTGANPEQRT